MEITEATETAGTDAGTGAEAAPAGGGEQQQGSGAQAPDFDALFSRFEEKVGERFESLEERLPAPAGESVPEIPDPADIDAFFSDEDFADDGELTQEAQERHFWATVQKEAATIAEAKVKEALSPLQEQQEQERRGQAADALEAKYLELQNADVVEKVLDAAVRHAQRLGVPPEQVNQVATEPAFIELTYLAMKATEQTAGEPAPAAPGVTLESGGAAGPADAQDAPDLGDRIVKLANESKFRLGRK